MLRNVLGVRGAGRLSRSTVGRSCFFGGHGSALIERSRLWRGSDRRPPLIYRGAQLLIAAGGLCLLVLSLHRRNVPVVGHPLFLGRRTCDDPTFTAVVTDVTYIPLIDIGHVNVVNVLAVYVVDRAVVIPPIVVPATTFVAAAEVAIPIIDSAVITYLRRPVARVEGVSVIAPSPIRRSPEESGLGRQYPCSGHPVVIAERVVPGPLAGRPDITLVWQNRLLVHRQSRRSKVDDYDLALRCRRQAEHG